MRRVARKVAVVCSQGTRLGGFDAARALEICYSRWTESGGPTQTRRASMSNLCRRLNHMKATSSGRRPLWKHQKAALKALRAEFGSADRAQVYMVPGAGKTRTFLTLARDYERVVILCPTRLLLRETLENLYREDPSSREVPVLAVCSRGTVSREDDSIGLPVRESTSADVVREHMSGDGRRIVLGTYYSSPAIRDANVDFDLGVFDEGHHCAQVCETRDSRRATSLLDDVKTRIRKRLFVTASPRVYTARVKSGAAENGHIVTSMDDIARFGRVVFDLGYAAALKSGDNVVKPLNVWTVEWVVEPDQDWNDARHFALVGGWKWLRDNGHDVSRLLSFSNDRHSSNRVVDVVRRQIPDVFAEHVDCYEYTPEQRAELLTEFRYDPRGGVVSSVGCLTEGINTPYVDGVAFADPRHAEIGVIQSAGRAVRFDPGKPNAEAHVLVPLLFSAEGNYLPESMEHVADVLGALSTMDTSLRMNVSSVGQRSERSRVGSINLTGGVIPDIAIDEVLRRINMTLFSGGDFDWWAKYDALLRYVVEWQRFPPEGSGLYAWAHRQKARKRGTLRRHPAPGDRLTSDQVEALGRIPGWTWSRNQEPVAFTCKQCGREFSVRACKARQGTPKYCSQSCVHAALRRNTCKRGHDLTQPGARTKTGSCVMCARRRASDHYYSRKVA